jgi:hypothetical protein
MYHETSMFSPPLSERTQDGSPNLSTADLKHWRTVEARLFVEHARNTTIREKPSILP